MVPALLLIAGLAMSGCTAAIKGPAGPVTPMAATTDMACDLDSPQSGGMRSPAAPAAANSLDNLRIDLAPSDPRGAAPNRLAKLENWTADSLILGGTVGSGAEAIPGTLNPDAYVVVLRSPLTLRSD